MIRGENSNNEWAPELRRLLLLFLAVALVRLVAAWRVCVISMDGATQFIPLAQWIAGGHFFDVMLGHGQAPLFPVTIWLAHFVAGDWVAAAQTAGVLFAAATVFPLYFVARDVAGKRAALATVLVYAFHPDSVRFSVDALPEPAFIALLTTALWCGLRAVRTGGLGWHAAAGAAAGLACLTRPEGMGVALVVGAWGAARMAAALVRGDTARARIRAAARIGLGLMAMVIVFAALAGPYIRDVGRPGGAAEPRGGVAGSARTRPVPDALLGLARKYLDTFHVTIVLLAVGLAVRRPRTSDRLAPAFVASAFGLYAMLHVGAAVLWGYASRRCALQGVALLMPWMGVGTVALWDARGSATRKRAAALAQWLLVIVAAVMCAGSFKARRRSHLGDRTVGAWIKGYAAKPRPRLLALCRTRAPLYFDGVEQGPPWDRARPCESEQRTFAELMAYVQRTRPDFMLVDAGRIALRVPDFFAASKEYGLDPIFRCSRRGDTAPGADLKLWLYEFRWQRQHGIGRTGGS